MAALHTKFFPLFSLMQLFIELGYVVVPLGLEEVSSDRVTEIVFAHHVFGFRVVATFASQPQLRQRGGDPAAGLLVDCK